MLGSQATPHWTAPHFVWAVRDELADKVCGVGTPTCKALENGGLRVTTTLDTNIQKIAEKWVQAAAIVPHAKNPTAAAKALGFKKLEPWMANLRTKDLHNGALVAYDYQTGELIAYVGSANYYATSTKPDFQPQFDVAGKGFRQPGSAFKPFNYVDRHRRPQDHRRHDADGRRDRLRELHAERRRQPRARTRARPERAPVLAQHPVGQDDGDQRPRPRLRQGQGLRDELPGQADGRARPGAGSPGGPAGRPRHGLRDAGQRRQGDRPHDDPDDQGHRRQGPRRRPTPRPPASRRSARRRPSS